MKAKPTTCSACGQKIVWLTPKTGYPEWLPVNASTVKAGDDGYDYKRHILHFDNCPGRISKVKHPKAFKHA